MFHRYRHLPLLTWIAYNVLPCMRVRCHTRRLERQRKSDLKRQAFETARNSFHPFAGAYIPAPLSSAGNWMSFSSIGTSDDSSSKRKKSIDPLDGLGTSDIMTESLYRKDALGKPYLEARTNMESHQVVSRAMEISHSLPTLLHSHMQASAVLATLRSQIMPQIRTWSKASLAMPSRRVNTFSPRRATRRQCSRRLDITCLTLAFSLEGYFLLCHSHGYQRVMCI